MNKYPKRLIEVDLPIKRISEHARREKSIRHGHISTLHIWWARRPLAACRAVICAALWPDPADPLCPPAFRVAATAAINGFAQRAMNDKTIDEKASKISMGRWATLHKVALEADNPQHWNLLRYALLDFIADFANWDNSTHPVYLQTSRALTQAAHEALGGLPGTRPLVVDPFAGGGAIPLEALRVGADAFASDLNPVAVLLNKVVLEYIPRYGQQLADEVRKWGQWVKEEAEKELAEFYPPDPDGATPIAYLWARTITCEGPGCGAEVPLLRSLWLAKRKKGSVALRLIPNPAEKRVDFAIIEDAKAKDVGEGTVARGSATCPSCGYTTPVTSVREQMSKRRGGAHDARLFAVVTSQANQQGRSYRLPTERDLNVVQSAYVELEKRKHAQKDETLSLVPDEPLPPVGTLGFRVQRYGMKEWGDLFTSRQALSLTTLVSKVQQVGQKVAGKYEDGLETAVHTCLALAIDRQADYLSSLVIWSSTGEFIAHTFGRQALPIVWEWPECNLWVNGSGNWAGAIDWIRRAIESNISEQTTVGHTELSSATRHPLPDNVAQAFVTDPPYYDAVPYADLSDFFVVWLKRSLGNLHTNLFFENLAPKEDECIVDEIKGKDKLYFEKNMGRAMAEGHRILAPNGIGVVVFAHKSTTGWEAQLQAMIEAGWTVTGSWPIDTERPGRLRAQGSAALASSVHLICRPRETDEIGDWRDVLHELPGRINAWLPRLAQEGVVGADAIFACLGPALEIFSRYGRVEKASGEIVTLGEYLEYVWAAVSREALNMVFAGADTSGFEEDARLTAMWLWTLSTDASPSKLLEQKSDFLEKPDLSEEAESVPAKPIPSTGYVLEYDAARKIAQGLGAHLEQLGHLIEISGSNARLLPVTERTRYLFGQEGLKPTNQRKRETGMLQLSLLDQLPEEAAAEWRLSEEGVRQGKTMLDRVHQTMLLFAAGRSDGLKSFLVDGGLGQDERFWRLAQALSALYPVSTDEKRWVDGVLARKKGLGF